VSVVFTNMCISKNTCLTSIDIIDLFALLVINKEIKVNKHKEQICKQCNYNVTMLSSMEGSKKYYNKLTQILRILASL
jgi:hypothetical protein